jgi:Zn finger protein HypA/HybF involved in hydrogenase expression
MSLTNCRECGKLYLMERSFYCPDCKAEQEALYRTVRDFIKQNPNSTVLEIHLQTGISIAKILEMQKNEYFRLS